MRQDGKQAQFRTRRHLHSTQLQWTLSVPCAGHLGSLLSGPKFLSPSFCCFAPNTCSVFQKTVLGYSAKVPGNLGVSSWESLEPLLAGVGL